MVNNRKTFITYSRKHKASKEYIEALIELEESLGIHVIYDQGEVLIGQDWRKRLLDLMSECSTIIALLSRESLTSPHVQFEIAIALFRRHHDKNFIFIPVWLDCSHEDSHWSSAWALQEIQGSVNRCTPEILKQTIKTDFQRRNEAYIKQQISDKDKYSANPQIINEALLSYYLPSQSDPSIGLYKIESENIELVLPDITQLNWLGWHVPIEPESTETFLEEKVEIPRERMVLCNAARARFSLPSRKPNLQNGSQFQLVEVHADRGEFIFSEARFFDSLFADTGALEEELISTIESLDIQGESEIGTRAAQHLGWRDLLMPDIRTALELSDRTCLGGLSVFLAINMENEFVVPVSRRSKAVADRKGLKQLLPRGFHSPQNKRYLRKCNGEIFQTITDITYRKIVQQLELIHGSSLSDQNSEMTSRVSELLCLHTSIFLTGLSISLLNGNYTFHAFVDCDSSFFAAWEAEIGPLLGMELDLMPLTSKTILECLYKSHEWSSDSLVTLFEGINYLQSKNYLEDLQISRTLL